MKCLDEPASLLYRRVVGIVPIRRDILDDNLNSRLEGPCVVSISKGLARPAIDTFPINAVRDVYMAINEQGAAPRT